jgi:DnaK suppressor protein
MSAGLTHVNEERGRRAQTRRERSMEPDMLDRTRQDIRSDLVWTREQIARRLARIRDDVAHRLAPLSPDAADRAQETENDEVLERLGQSATALIRQYQRAIDRIDAGRYGLCEACELPIEAERLAAVPQATECMECAKEKRRPH